MANVYEIKVNDEFYMEGFGPSEKRFRSYTQAYAEKFARYLKSLSATNKVEVVGPPEYGTQEIRLPESI